MFNIVSAVALLALTKLVVAVPPACLLTAVNAQPQPGELDFLCSTAPNDLRPAITELCGEEVDAALAYFAEVCGDTRVGVPKPGFASSTTSRLPSSSGTATTTGRSSQVSTGSSTPVVIRPTGISNGTSPDGSVGNNATISAGTPTILPDNPSSADILNVVGSVLLGAVVAVGMFLSL